MNADEQKELRMVLVGGYAYDKHGDSWYYGDVELDGSDGAFLDEIVALRARAEAAEAELSQFDQFLDTKDPDEDKAAAVADMNACVLECWRVVGEAVAAGDRDVLVSDANRLPVRAIASVLMALQSMHSVFTKNGVMCTGCEERFAFDEIQAHVASCEQHPLSKENQRLTAALAEAREDARGVTNVLGFFASAIKCGEPWSDDCEKMLRAAFAHREKRSTPPAPEA